MRPGGDRGQPPQPSETRMKYHSVQGFDRASRPRIRTAEEGGSVRRPHSVDAEFLHQLERMGLSQSLPPFTTVSTKMV